MAATRVFTRMRADHRRVLGEMRALVSAAARLGGRARTRGADLATLRRLVRMLGRQFATHMAAEDEVLFPALRRAIPGAAPSLAPLGDEHEELRAMLGSLAERLASSADAARDQELPAQARDFADLLRIHIRKEEALVFRVAERVLRPDELARLAERRSPVTPPARSRGAAARVGKGSTR